MSIHQEDMHGITETALNNTQHLGSGPTETVALAQPVGMSGEQSLGQSPIEIGTIPGSSPSRRPSSATGERAYVAPSPYRQRRHTVRNVAVIGVAATVVAGVVGVGVPAAGRLEHRLLDDGAHDAAHAIYGMTIGAGEHLFSDVFDGAGHKATSVGRRIGSLAHNKYVAPTIYSQIDTVTEEQHVNMTFSGGTVTGYVGVEASHVHRLGGGVYDKLLPYEAWVGDSAKQITTGATLIYKDKESVRKNAKGKIISSKLIPNSDTLEKVEVAEPVPSILGASIQFTSLAMEAPLHAGESVKDVNTAIGKLTKEIQYDKAHGKSLPSAATGFTCHQSSDLFLLGKLLPCVGLTGADKSVVTLGNQAAQFNVLLDGFNPDSRNSARLVAETDQAALDYAEGHYKGVPIVLEKTKPEDYTQILSGRAKALAGQIGAVTSEAFFTYDPKDPVKGTSKTNPEFPLEFFMEGAGGVKMYVTLGDKLDVAQIQALNRQDFPAEAKFDTVKK